MNDLVFPEFPEPQAEHVSDTTDLSSSIDFIEECHNGDPEWRPENAVCEQFTLDPESGDF